jgi:RimJ/RimL family protein N-acetyltransferase
MTLRTPRLILRRWQPQDAVPLAAINADPQVMRWIGDGSGRDEAQTRASIQAWERHWDERGFGLFAVEVRETGELAGLAGMAIPAFLPEVMPAVEIAWRLGQAHWGQGIATEAAREALEFAFAECQLARVIAIVQVGNDASERVMHKLGMRLERETTDPSSGRPVRVHEITRPTWSRGRAGGV